MWAFYPRKSPISFGTSRMTKLQVFTACPAKVGQYAFGNSVETVAKEL
jgi:hypothetical protein